MMMDVPMSAVATVQAAQAAAGLAAAAAPTLLANVTPPACNTKGRETGICCKALTQLGAAAAAAGFSYVSSCDGKTRCMKCGIRPSHAKCIAAGTCKPHEVFVPKRMSCGPSGCPALLGQ